MAPPPPRPSRGRRPLRRPSPLPSRKLISKGNGNAMCRRMMVLRPVQTNNHGSRDSSVTIHGPPDIFEGSEKTSLDKLPEDILSHIHSLVPLRDAARAACVSHRFRRSWRCFPNLAFDLEALGLSQDKHIEYEERANNVVDRVHNILQNHSGIGVKTLKLNLCACRNVITAYYVESWLKRIVQPGIMELAIIRMLPQCERFTVLHELRKDKMCPISTGYLLDLVKDDINTECNLYSELEDYEALSPCFKDCLDFLYLNLSRPYGDNSDSWEKVLDCLSLLTYLLIRGSRTLSKPVVRRLILELLAPLRYHLTERPEDEDDYTVQEDIACEAVKYCMELANKLV